MPTLTIQLPGLPSVEHIVREDAITLGRMKGNSIALNDSSVSLSHAKITRVGNDFFLKDLNSTNGTMLNGQSITEARLRDGDQLKFGEVIAYFRLEPLSAPAPAPAVSLPAPVPTVLPVSSDSAAALMPKPTAQSVPTPPLAPATVPPVRSSPSPAIRSAPLPPLPASGGKSLKLPLLILGGAAILAVAGLLAWKFFSGKPEAAATTLPVERAAAKPAPVSSTPVSPAIPAPAKATTPPVLDRNLEDLMNALKSPDVVVRRHAAAAIYNLGPDAKDVLPVLPAALTDADPDVRMWVALALVHNNVFEKATIPILVQTLRHENPTLRQVACLSLAMIPYTDADKETVVPALVDVATKDASPDVANDALTALKIIAPDLVVGK
jgi:hypothetical protein